MSKVKVLPTSPGDYMRLHGPEANAVILVRVHLCWIDMLQPGTFIVSDVLFEPELVACQAASDAVSY